MDPIARILGAWSQELTAGAVALGRPGPISVRK